MNLALGVHLVEADLLKALEVAAVKRDAGCVQPRAVAGREPARHIRAWRDPTTSPP